MAKPQEFVVTLEGLEQDAEDLRFRAFARKLDDVKDALRISGRESGAQSPPDYLIVGLTKQSPTQLRLSPLDAFGLASAQALTQAVNRLRNAKALPPDFSEDMLDAVKRLLHGCGKLFRRMRVTGPSIDAIIDDQLVEAVAAIERGDVVAYGSIKGAVERFNSHDGANNFYIYPMLRRGVRCDFTDDLLEDAAKAVTKTATVSGVLRYHAGRFDPYACSVKEIDVHREDSELPSLSGLYGVAPDMTGDVDTAEFIRRVRSGWDQ